MEIAPRNRDRRRKPEDDKTLRRLAKRYDAGLSIRQLATETGWAYGTVHRRIKLAAAAGLIVVRRRGGITREQRERGRRAR